MCLCLRLRNEGDGNVGLLRWLAIRVEGVEVDFFIFRFFSFFQHKSAACVRGKERECVCVCGGYVVQLVARLGEVNGGTTCV